MSTETNTPTITATTIARFEEITFQMITIYQRWLEDKKLAEHQAKNMHKLIKDLAANIEQFNQISAAVRPRLVQLLQEQAIQMKQQTTNTLHETITSEVQPITQQLRVAIQETQQLLANHQESSIKVWGRRLCLLAAGMVVSICSALLIVQWQMPQPRLPLTNQQLDWLGGGELMEKVFSRMPKSEKELWRKMADQVQAEKLSNNYHP